MLKIIVPTRNPGDKWGDWCEFINSQKKVKVFNLDSESTDSTIEISKQYGFTTYIIEADKFNHGGSRNFAFNYFCNIDDIVLFITQDAFLYGSNSIDDIVNYFNDSSVAAVCGRQIPHDDANPIASHARFFNYPDISRIMEFADIPTYGLKTAFVSNSFTAYRASIFKKLGGFPEDVILSEDMHLAARMVLSGYKIVYAADACVKHSHNYTPWQEFKRYFDIGVFHSTESWIQEKFGGAGGEGKRFLISEFKYLLKIAPMWIPRACITNCCKILGYKLGKNYKKLPRALRPKLSMHKAYWSQKER